MNIEFKKRLTEGLKKYIPILMYSGAMNESKNATADTVVEMLCEMFGYDRTEHVSARYKSKNKFYDIELKPNKKTNIIIKCMPAGVSLEDDQVDRAANHALDIGTGWVCLTNGAEWRIYKITQKPEIKRFIYEFDIVSTSWRNMQNLADVYNLCIEGFADPDKSALDILYMQLVTFNCHIIGQVLLSDPGVQSIKKLIRKIYPDLQVDKDELYYILQNDIIKQEIVKGKLADQARINVEEQIKEHI